MQIIPRNKKFFAKKFASADLSQQRRWLFGFVCEGIKFGSYLFDTLGNRSLCEAECFRNLALRFALEIEQDNISVDFVIKRSEKTFCQIDKRRLVIYRLIVPISERFVIGIKLIKGEHLAELGAGVIPFPLKVDAVVVVFHVRIEVLMSTVLFGDLQNFRHTLRYHHLADHGIH